MIVTLTSDDRVKDPAALAARMIEQGHRVTEVRERGRRSAVRTVWRAQDRSVAA